MDTKTNRSGNTQVRTDGDTLIIEIDLSRKVGPSSKGISDIIGTSNGNQNLCNAFAGTEAGEALTTLFPNGLFIGVNAYTPIPEAEWSAETKATVAAERAAKANGGKGRVSKFA